MLNPSALLSVVCNGKELCVSKSSPRAAGRQFNGSQTLFVSASCPLCVLHEVLMIHFISSCLLYLLDLKKWSFFQAFWYYSLVPIKQCFAVFTPVNFSTFLYIHNLLTEIGIMNLHNTTHNTDAAEVRAIAITSHIINKMCSTCFTNSVSINSPEQTAS